MASTLNTFKIYMSKQSGQSGFNVYARVVDVDTYSTEPDDGSVLGTSNAVDISTVNDHGSQGWVEFTFATPITIDEDGFYGIEVYASTTNYNKSQLRFYEASDWDDATGGEPYAGKERGWKEPIGGWSAGITIAYDMTVSGIDANNATTATSSYASASLAVGIRTYLEASGPAKPTNPNPADDATTDPVYDRTLAWSVGNLANYDTMDVYLGTESGSLSKLETITPALSYVVDEGDWPQDSQIYWRVDGTKDSVTTTGDEWDFDPRPDKATNPTPADAAGSISTNQSRLYFDKDGYKTQSHNIYFGETGDISLIDSGNINEYVDIDLYLPLEYGTEYTWRVDSVSTNGTTTGDSWTFTTGSLSTVWPSFRLLDGGSGLGPDDDPAGIEGTDWEWTGYNFIATVRRVVAAADNRIWIQE